MNMHARKPKMDVLIGLLQSDSEVVRCLAAQALGRIGEPCALPPLLPLLGDEDEDVRFDAVEALGRLGDSRAVEPLCALYHDPGSADLKVAAVEAHQQKLGLCPDLCAVH